MNVKSYTYKVEFQDRGAGHIHGTLWLRLEELELLKRGEDGKLRSCTKEEKINARTNKSVPEKGPLGGLKKAFTKIRKNQKLNEKEDIPALRQFIDEFTTVSTHENTVGKVVARIAQEVNKHNHTKTC